MSGLTGTGSPAPHEQEIEERSATFLALFAAAIFLLAGLFGVTWYMMRPRLGAVLFILAGPIEWVMIGSPPASWRWYLIEVCLRKGQGKSLLPYKWAARLVLLALPKALWLGGRFGISRDRVGNSFIKVHNYIVATHAERVNP